MQQSSRALLARFSTAGALALLAHAAAAQSVFVNELHYDNDGTDSGEAIEIAGPAGTDLTGCSIVLYNGNGGGLYNTTALDGVIPDQQGGFGTVTFNYPTNGIQNGGEDGIALVGAAGVIQFLSYEGTVTAIDGPAIGLTSTDIGVSESSGTAVGDSLQLTGSGAEAGAFAWAAAAPNTFDAVNTGQAFGGAPAAGDPCGGSGGDPGDPGAIAGLVINEILADPASGADGDANRDGLRDSSDDEFVEIVNTSREGIDISGWTLSDEFSVRHAFPSGSIVAAGCAVVVFGGDTPTGAFGNALVQTASGGFLGFNNGGDVVTLDNGSGSVSVAYGGEGGGNESLTRDPDVTGGLPLVQHSGATGSGGTLFSPGTRVTGAQFAGCEPLPTGPFEIYEIQGEGAASPFVGR
ncbi:MAG TPA: lamin tail domain-containing protein, partial [Woeseiaceae bacterium]|nr:lamin tail domain-containing protein [Woeseiaceae bacterium]